MGKFVKNVTDRKLEVMFGGEVHKWPVGAAIWFDDEATAKWFLRKGEHPKSPADGRPDTTNDFILQDRLDDGVLPVEEVLVAPAVEEPAIPLDPKAPSQVHPGNPELKDIKIRRELDRHPKEQLLAWCKKHGLYTKGMDRGRMIDRLAGAGFVPPVA